MQNTGVYLSVTHFLQKTEEFVKENFTGNAIVAKYLHTPFDSSDNIFSDSCCYYRFQSNHERHVYYTSNAALVLVLRKGLANETEGEDSNLQIFVFDFHGLRRGGRGGSINVLERFFSLVIAVRIDNPNPELLFRLFILNSYHLRTLNLPPGLLGNFFYEFINKFKEKFSISKQKERVLNNII